MLGNTFSAEDLLMYAIGGGVAVWLDIKTLTGRAVRPGRTRSQEMSE
jgi:hypothetical protein